MEPDFLESDLLPGNETNEHEMRDKKDHVHNISHYPQMYCGLNFFLFIFVFCYFLFSFLSLPIRSFLLSVNFERRG